ncbi:uncharacterized protein N7500_000692 [Penicillium coprophilum]|uniref:uncharacterized protein n=1 Tax=Penicillium coprophilum TaxID=36646 RepID=UPI00238AAC1D|nr:uncharacterized protein N7500_000692 [Penicillium coprophilum]KAJ5177993.1 hypothetical protein N7500_000692 [Penicillium coprophilum]
MPPSVKVCYMDPLQIVPEQDRNLHKSSSTQTAPLDELFRRCDFDWAEDAEEVATNTSNTHESLNYSLPEANLHNEIHPIPRHLIQPKYKPSLATIDEEVWDEAWGRGYGSPPRHGELDEDILPSSPNPDFNTVAEHALNNIFADRQAWIDVDEGIHHFNWMGLRVYTHSATSPSDSLAIILAQPKNPQGSEMWRIHSVLNRASHYIDPVLVLLDGTDESLFELRGTKLVRESTGRVFKFYSPHGKWTKDESDRNDETITDFGSTQTYEEPDLAVGNGFVESSVIRSLSQWQECRDEAFETSEELRRLPRKLTWEKMPSPLRQCETIPTPASSEPSCHQIINQAKRPPRKITTCVLGAPSEEYFSFPTPTFGRRGLTRKSLDKARRGLQSMFSSLKSTLY